MTSESSLRFHHRDTEATERKLPQASAFPPGVKCLGVLCTLCGEAGFAYQFAFPLAAGRGRPVSKDESLMFVSSGDAAPSRRISRIAGLIESAGNAAGASSMDPQFNVGLCDQASLRPLLLFQPQSSVASTLRDRNRDSCQPFLRLSLA